MSKSKSVILEDAKLTDADKFQIVYLYALRLVGRSNQIDALDIALSACLTMQRGTTTRPDQWAYTEEGLFRNAAKNAVYNPVRDERKVLKRFQVYDGVSMTDAVNKAARDTDVGVEIETADEIDRVVRMMHRYDDNASRKSKMPQIAAFVNRHQDAFDVEMLCKEFPGLRNELDKIATQTPNTVAQRYRRALIGLRALALVMILIAASCVAANAVCGRNQDPAGSALELSEIDSVASRTCLQTDDLLVSRTCREMPLSVASRTCFERSIAQI